MRSCDAYLEMRDGVRIAIDVWLPEGLSAGEQVPTVMRATRYWRMQDRPGPPPDGKSPIPGADNQYRQDLREIQLFTAARYALVLIDARGSGASFGTRRFELAEEAELLFHQCTGSAQPVDVGVVEGHELADGGLTAIA